MNYLWEYPIEIEDNVCGGVVVRLWVVSRVMITPLTKKSILLGVKGEGRQFEINNKSMCVQTAPHK